VDTLDRFPKENMMENWKKDGVYFVENARTKQKMPHYYQFYEDFNNNKQRFDVECCMEMLKAHVLIIHGTNDEAVNEKSAEHLHILNPNSELFLIENGNHTFGAKEPWENDQLPEDLNTAIEKSINFMRENSL